MTQTDFEPTSKYGARSPMTGLRLFHGLLAAIPDFAESSFSQLHVKLDERFVGLTTDGIAREGLVSPADGPSTAAAAEAANDYLDLLSRPDQRLDAVRPLDHPHRRWWINAFPDWTPSGLLLDDLTADERAGALRIVESCMSPHGYAEVRNVMRLNGLLGEYVNTYVDSLGEWTYFFTIYGEPSPGQPWGWQLMGHHLALNAVVLPNHLTLTPMFLGAEFNDVSGVAVLGSEADLALTLAQSLTSAQQEKAILYRTMDPAKLPPELAGPVDGRHIGGAGSDNLITPYVGVNAEDLNDSQRDQLIRLIDVYLNRLPEAQRQKRLAEITTHLAETYFAWIGDPADGAPFYYRVHSPVVWLEFDHHQGIFLDNDLPEPYHVHTIFRTPNGADYGADLVPLHGITEALQA